MSKWLSPQKMLDYHIVRRFGDVAEAERQLYLAVVRGDVRGAQWKILGPEWLKQLCRMKISEDLLVRAAARYRIGSEDAPRPPARAAHWRWMRCDRVTTMADNIPERRVLRQLMAPWTA